MPEELAPDLDDGLLASRSPVNQAHIDSCHSDSLTCIAFLRVINGPLDDVDFAEHFSIAKPVCPEWVRIHEGVAFQEQVGH
jgi:hypothetical protein